MKESENKKRQAAEDKLFNFRPLLFTAIALVFGIYFCFLIKIKGVSRWWLFGLLPLIATPFCFCFSKTKLKRTVIAVGCLLVAFIVGTQCFSTSINRYCQAPKYDGEYAVVGRVISSKEKGDNLFVYLDNLSVDSTLHDGVLMATLPIEEKKHVGLRNIRGRLSAMVNGELIVESQVGTGTKAVIMIPKEVIV